MMTKEQIVTAYHFLEGVDSDDCSITEDRNGHVVVRRHKSPSRRGYYTERVWISKAGQLVWDRRPPPGVVR